MWGTEEMNEKWRVVYDNDQIFTIFWCGKQVAWSQWSPLYQLWRVLICDTGEMHHVETSELALDVCAGYLGVDRA
jgi:hypothetical protein